MTKFFNHQYNPETRQITFSNNTFEKTRSVDNILLVKFVVSTTKVEYRFYIVDVDMTLKNTIILEVKHPIEYDWLDKFVILDYDNYCEYLMINKELVKYIQIRAGYKFEIALIYGKDGIYDEVSIKESDTVRFKEYYKTGLKEGILFILENSLPISTLGLYDSYITEFKEKYPEKVLLWELNWKREDEYDKF